MQPSVQNVTFTGSQGDQLAARLDLPAGPVRATALFAHCFTCSKDIAAARRVATGLAREGIAVLRFDFTGLGASQGEFANTNFSSNTEDLRLAADWLRESLVAPTILIGHSLGGAAVLSVAGDIPEAKAVATIGAPADADHVLHNFAADIADIESDGEVEVSLAGRKFTIRRQFLDDLKVQNLSDRIASMRKAIMVLHSPLDQTVGIENAAGIFTAARHPKSFVSLDGADHLLSDSGDAQYAATMIAAWASRFIDTPAMAAEPEAGEGVIVEETGEGKFQNYVIAGRHRMFADEPESVGGQDTGPTPYGYLSAALGACTAMTLRMYANFKKVDVGTIRVSVTHGKVHAADCDDCAHELVKKGGKIDRFERTITIAGEIDRDLQAKLLEIADKCPVHKTLEKGAAVATSVAAEP